MITVLKMDFVQQNTTPRRGVMSTTSSLSQAGAAGFIDNYVRTNNIAIYETDAIMVSASDGNDWFYPTIGANGSITLNPTSFLIGVPTLAGNNDFTGSNIFAGPFVVKAILNPLVSNRAQTALTANTGTLTATQVAQGEILFTPTADATWTFPLATSLDSLLDSPFIGGGIYLRLTNNSTFKVTFSPNTGITFPLLSNSSILELAPGSSVFLTVIKNAATPAYILSGPSFGSLSYYEQNYIHETDWSGIWAAPKSGDCSITRMGNQVFMRIPVITDVATTAAVMEMNTPFPVRFRPSAQLTQVINVIDSGTNINTMAAVLTNGTVAIFGTDDFGNFTGSGSSGLSDVIYLNWTV